MKLIKLTLIAVLQLFAIGAILAQPGEIIESGDLVLDPNGDGFISIDNTGFSTDGYDVDEFEIKMFGIPIFGDGEALNDVQSGQPCGVVDLALDTAGYTLYAGFDNNENLIFRFRLAGDQKSVQSYSILIDTDQMVGSADPNSNATNPGFEIEITLIQKFGVYIYGIDGTDACPTPLKAYSVDTHQQKATSSQQSCGDTDIYIDFYVPFSDLTDLFGITPTTNLRFAGVTNISATCALDGSISDIGGVDDNEYGGCFSCAVLDLTENQCPSSVSNLCDTCGGFPLGATETPDIDLPVLVGDTQISGTAEPESDIYIELYSGLGNLLDRDTTTVDLVGNWLSGTFNTALSFGDSVVVNALLAGKCQSGLTDAGLSFAIVSPNQPPRISGSIQTINYIENTPPLIITYDIIITDDNTTLTSAIITIANNFEQGKDILDARPPPGISASFSANDGILSMSGTASLSDYDSALRSVSFHNLSEAPSLEIRTVSYTVNDGLNQSPAFNKNILITQVNDPPVIIIGSNPVDTIFIAAIEDVPIQICIEATDVELDDLSLASVSVKDGNGIVSFDQGLCLIFTPVANYNGIEYLTVRICDNGIPVLCDSVIVQIDVAPVNDPPQVLLNGIETDSLSYRIEQGTLLDFCIEVVDVENNNLIVESIILTSATTSTIVWQNELCFQYKPQSGFIGIDRAEITICDDGIPSRCTLVYLDLEVVDINQAPTITTTTADTIFIDVFKNNTANICLDAVDPDNDPLDFGSIVDLLGIGGETIFNYSCLDYTPPGNFVGTVLIKVSICDDITPPKCDDIILKINVLPFNNPPNVVVDMLPVDTVYFTTDINTSLDLCLEVFDVDDDNVITTNVVTDNGDGTFTIDGTLCLQFEPGLDIIGEVFGTVTICDDGDPILCTQTVINVSVTRLNDPPTILFNGVAVDTLFFESEINVEFELCIEALDSNGDDLSIAGIDEISPGGFYIPGSSNLCLGFVPDNNFIGETLHLVTICDNGSPQGCDSVFVKVNILSVNNPPELLFDGVQLDTIKVSTIENIPIEICVEANDIDGDEVSISDLLLIAGDGTVLSTQSGSQFCIVYDPALNFFGTSWVKIVVCDNGVPSRCAETIIQIEVLNKNNAPEVYQNGIVTDTIKFSVSARTILSECIDAIDLDGDNLSLAIISTSTAIGTVEIVDGDLCLSYEPNNNFLGADYFTLSVCDDGDPLLCTIFVVEVEVFSVNTPPVISYETMSVDTVSLTATEQNTLNIFFEVEDSPDDLLEIVNSVQTQGAGEFTVGLAGNLLTLDYTPNLFSKGAHIINISVCDDGLPILCDSVTVKLTVEQEPIFPYQAISPNGDGFNDFWVIQGIEYYPNNTIHIFDRWNNIVFTTQGYNNTTTVWSGQSNHGLTKADLNDGTYYYKIKLGEDGTIFSGMVIVKR